MELARQHAQSAPASRRKRITNAFKTSDSHRKGVEKTQGVVLPGGKKLQTHAVRKKNHLRSLPLNKKICMGIN